MAALDYQAMILESIDSLRRRKARPDLERICHMVERKYGLISVDVTSELERMVDADVVIKVDYKGNTSYRNAAKWSKSHLSGYQLNSNDATRTLLAAIEKLTVKDAASRTASPVELEVPNAAQLKPAQEKDGEGGSRPPQEAIANEGASLEEIEALFKEENPGTKFVRSYLEEALKREVSAKRLYVSPAGKYVLAKYAVSPGDKIKRNRPPLKRKRVKKTHGPEWEQASLVKTSTWDQKCDYCTLPAGCNKFGEKEELLVCKDCALKVHPSCMKYSKELAERSRLSPWQCIDCKTCHVCNDAGDADTLLFCDSCDKGYHMACHNPPVEEKPLGKWICELCTSEDMEIGSNWTDEDSLASSTASMESMPEEKIEPPPKKSSRTSGQVSPDVATPNQSMTANLPEQSAQSQAQNQTQTKAQAQTQHAKASGSGQNSPNAWPTTHPAKWSIDEVARFFAEKGFKEEALTLKEQEIDGNALLLLRRSDVLTGLSFKLGRALKMYKCVSDIQLSNAKGHATNSGTVTTPHGSKISSKTSLETNPPKNSGIAPRSAKTTPPKAVGTATKSAKTTPPRNASTATKAAKTTLPKTTKAPSKRKSSSPPINQPTAAKITPTQQKTSPRNKEALPNVSAPPANPCPPDKSPSLNKAPVLSENSPCGAITPQIPMASPGANDESSLPKKATIAALVAGALL